MCKNTLDESLKENTYILSQLLFCFVSQISRTVKNNSRLCLLSSPLLRKRSSHQQSIEQQWKSAHIVPRDISKSKTVLSQPRNIIMNVEKSMELARRVVSSFVYSRRYRRCRLTSSYNHYMGTKRASGSGIHRMLHHLSLLLTAIHLIPPYVPCWSFQSIKEMSISFLHRNVFLRF